MKEWEILVHFFSRLVTRYLVLLYWAVGVDVAVAVDKEVEVHPGKPEGSRIWENFFNIMYASHIEVVRLLRK